MGIRNYLQLFFLILIIISCDNTVEPNLIDSENLVNGVINLNEEKVNFEISKLLSDLTPQVNSNDEFGHAKNINTLIERINSSSKNIESSLICYSCIKTLPSQSEILLTTDSSNISVNRVIDIITPSNGKLTFGGIHY
jgi:hypothetical protein